MSCFVDTSAFLALLDADDLHHDDVRRRWSALMDRDEKLVTTNYAVVECLAVLQRRAGLAVVRRFYDDLLPAADEHWVSHVEHEGAVRAVMSGGRRGPSIVDCVSFGVIAAQGIGHVLAYDQHFADQGYELPPTP